MDQAVTAWQSTPTANAGSARAGRRRTDQLTAKDEVGRFVERVDRGDVIDQGFTRFGADELPRGIGEGRRHV